MKFTRRSAVIAAMLTAALAATSACSSDDKKDEGSGSSEIKLTVDTFGTVGINNLVKTYEASHPGIKIEITNEKETETVYVPKLLQHLETGSGAGDVVMIEEGFIGRMKTISDKFVDLNQYGAAELKNNFIPWKWNFGTSPDGSKQFALGTNVGGMGLCYRSDLFKKAGFPTDRKEVAAMLPDWDAFLTKGKEYQSKVKNSHWVDSPTSIFNTRLAQEAGAGNTFTYFDASQAYIAQTNPAVKTAFDYAAALHANDLTARLKTFDNPWAAAFKSDKFATLACPSWMLSSIKENAGDAYKGKWDVTTPPGGGGNWGGSFLAVPTQSKHPKEAAELAEFLTSPESQIVDFQENGGLPSSPQALNDPKVKGFVNDYFNNAPVGEIFAATAINLKPVNLGAKNSEVRAAFEDTLLALDQGKLTADKAWTKALEDGQKKAE